VSGVTDIAPSQLRRHLSHLCARLDVLIVRRTAGTLHPQLGKRALRALLVDMQRACERHEHLYGAGVDAHRVRLMTDEIAVHIETALETNDRDDFLVALGDARTWAGRWLATLGG